MYRTKKCNEARINDEGNEITLAGWINSIRDHGGIIFADLRDQFGLTQVVLTEKQSEGLTKETVISVNGKIRRRENDAINPKLETGEVELVANEISILSRSRNSLPFEIAESEGVNEEVRLKYRYLDLRNQTVLKKILLRTEIIKDLRKNMEELGFTEIQTPILANSSPEGARDYLVPSRRHKGKFYALPQAPQQFKQLLIASGIDKYFQIAPCFRDEDARADRAPGDFYQLDFEMAFATAGDVFKTAEVVLSKTFKKFSSKKVTDIPFPVFSFKEAMLKFGTDKPDLRNPLEIIELTDFFSGVDFKPFQGEIVRGIRVPEAGKNTGSFFRSLEKFAFSIGMKGLGYITVNEDLSFKGPFDKFFSNENKTDIKKIAGLKPFDILYFISAKEPEVSLFSGEIRTELAKRLDLIKDDSFKFCFVNDFPMYEKNAETGKIDFTHNPFSMPKGELDALNNKDPLDIIANQYDIIVNGIELSSGAVRNHRPEIMKKAFKIAGYDEDEIKKKFAALYEAFFYGVPPHAGMAPGIDRIVMLLSGDDNIREVIPFPLNSSGVNPMLDSPSEISETQLRETHIKIRN